MAGVLFRTVIRCRYGSMTVAAVAMYLDEFLEEMIPLIAEDLRTARARLGITSARAAKRARLDAARSRALEKGAVQRSQHTIALMVSVARSLSLKSIRASYADEIGQYMRIDLSTDRPLTTFVDNLEVDVTQLKEQGHFVSPYGVLALVEPTGFYTTFESSSPIDKRIVELWIAAVFTLGLGRGRDYYVRLVSDDPPDVEVLVIDRKSTSLNVIRVEITQHGRHSKSLVGVIGKKLLKRYQDGTVLVVLVEQSASVPVADVYEFIRKNNPHHQRIYIIGGGAEAGSFVVLPCDEISSPTPARKYGIAGPVLYSWLKTLNYVGNICAHHARLWNRELATRPTVPNVTNGTEWHRPQSIDANRMFVVLTILRFLLHRVAPQSAWRDRLFAQFDRFPDVPLVSMGMDAGWRQHTLWR